MNFRPKKFASKPCVSYSLKRQHPDYTVFIVGLAKISEGEDVSMITTFNRKELRITYDMAIQAKVGDILASNNIDYIIKVRNVHPYALNLCSYEYKIYVHKNDYEQACYLIKDVFR